MEGGWQVQKGLDLHLKGLRKEGDRCKKGWICTSRAPEGG